MSYNHWNRGYSCPINQVGNTTISANIWRREKAYKSTYTCPLGGRQHKSWRVGFVVDGIHINGERIKGSVRIKWTGQVVSNTLPEYEAECLAVQEVIRRAQLEAINDYRQEQVGKQHRFDRDRNGDEAESREWWENQFDTRQGKFDDVAVVEEKSVMVKVRENLYGKVDLGNHFEATGEAKVHEFILGEEGGTAYRYGGGLKMYADGKYSTADMADYLVKDLGDELEVFVAEAVKAIAAYNKAQA